MSCWPNENNNFFLNVNFFIDYLVSFDEIVNIWAKKAQKLKELECKKGSEGPERN
jgi:hypothetical protein